MKSKYKVYIHLFPNGKYYVGLTVQNVKRRWLGGLGYKGQFVYNAILKYDWKNIKHKIYECETESEMKYLERYLIAYYNTTDRRFGYNISAGGEYAYNGVSSKYRKAIDQYSKQGVLIKTWELISAIKKELNYGISHISSCAKGKRSTVYNCYWCYAGEKPIFKTRWTHRKVLQYDLEGNFIAKFENAAEAGRSIGKRNATIVKCCNKEFKTAYNYIWKYEC